jgi:hypothetical protein
MLQKVPEKVVLHGNYYVAESFQIFRLLCPKRFEQSGNSEKKTTELSWDCVGLGGEIPFVTKLGNLGALWEIRLY